MNHTYPPGEFLSKKRAAQYVDLSVRTIDRLISRGLPTYRTGPRSKVLVRLSDIEAFLERAQRPQPKLNHLVDDVMESLRSSGKVSSSRRDGV